MPLEQTGEKSYYLTLMYKGQKYRYRILLYWEGSGHRWFFLYAKSRVIYLKFDTEGRISEEVINAKFKAPADFLLEVEKVFREHFKI